jgi:hypothetical protein
VWWGRGPGGQRASSTGSCTSPWLWGGATGAPRSRGLGVAVSRRTRRRVRRRRPVPLLATPTVRGGDAFARRTRQPSGPVRIELARRQPVARLPDRTAETVAPWLQEPPGGAVIARERSHAYADGAHPGAPAAIQGADRLHRLPTLAAALDQVFTTPGPVLGAVHDAWRQHPVPVAEGTVAGPVPPQARPRLPRSARPSARRAGRRRLRRSGCGPATGGPSPRVRRRSGGVRAPYRGISARPPARAANRGVTAAPVAWPRTPPRCGRVGTRAAAPRGGGFATANGGATPGAMAASPPLPAVCVRPRAGLPDNAVHGSRGRWWPRPGSGP